MIVPIGVPSLFKISKLISAAAFRTMSAIAWPGVGAVLKKNIHRPARMKSHYALAIHGLNVGDGDCPVEVFARHSGVVMLGSVANLETSAVSSKYTTAFTVSIRKTEAGGTCARPG